MLEVAAVDVQNGAYIQVERVPLYRYAENRFTLEDYFEVTEYIKRFSEVTERGDFLSGDRNPTLVSTATNALNELSFHYSGKELLAVYLVVTEHWRVSRDVEYRPNFNKLGSVLEGLSWKRILDTFIIGDDWDEWESNTLDEYLVGARVIADMFRAEETPPISKYRPLYRAGVHDYQEMLGFITNDIDPNLAENLIGGSR